jgi:glycosyltransferase involved in cell wall biosynthesis
LPGSGIVEGLLRILLWHGYLLTGSGSNLYTANIARVWRKQGHDVLLMCQEREVDDLGFVDAHGDFDEANREFSFAENPATAATGRCRLLRPNIGGLLPVYVYDEYEGFVVKRFVELTDDELARYTETNVHAMTTAIRSFEPETIVTGHEVMGPFIAREACAATGTSYLAKLHGSALEYAVKIQDRYRKYAAEGLGSAKVVTGGSNYMLEEAAAVIPGWRDKGVVVNPGCDVEIFRPRDRPEPDFPTVAYVGKFIASKGVHNFLAALGLTTSRDLRVVVVGYGGFEAKLHDLWTALKQGDAETVRVIAETGEDGKRLDALADLAARGGIDASFVDRLASVALEWPGRLDHGPLSEVLPDFDALVVPSVVPEAFGMVGAEAAASGVLPIVPGHSGIGEVGAALEKALDRPGLLTFDPAEPIEGIAHAIDRILDIPWEPRRQHATVVSEYARRVWSWETVADELLALASR